MNHEPSMRHEPTMNNEICAVESKEPAMYNRVISIARPWIKEGKERRSRWDDDEEDEDDAAQQHANRRPP